MVSLKHCILGVEGPHDQAFVGKLLETAGLKKFSGQHKHIDSFWVKFIPTYPVNGRLYARLDMPSIFTSHTHSVAVYQGEGSSLCPNLVDRMKPHEPYVKDIHAFGLVIDKHGADLVAKQKAEKLRELFPILSVQPGIITAGSPRTGIYVLPDNGGQGVLDSVLIKCASIAYPDYKIGAENYINSVDEARKKRWEPFDAEKALVACIVSVLQPGMSNTPSIAKDEWICEQTVKGVVEVASLYRFLRDLLELPDVELR